MKDANNQDRNSDNRNSTFPDGGPPADKEHRGWSPDWFRDTWLAALRAGLRLLTSDPRLGLGVLYDPVSYWRTAEFSYVLNGMRTTIPPGSRTFDLGSPKLLSALLATHLDYAVATCDVWHKEVTVAREYAVGLEAPVVASQQDGRVLAHPEDTFAAATTISVLEHIPDEGDSEAVAELARVVRPGGLIFGTVPYAHSPRETYVERDVYSRASSGDSIFFQRHYNQKTLAARLVEPQSVKIVDLEIWEEGFPVESHIYGTRLLKYLTPPIQPLLARISLRQGKPRSQRHGAAFFTLEVK